MQPPTNTPGICLQTSRRCPVCGQALASGRAHYCSPACKQQAYRWRQGAGNDVPAWLATRRSALKEQRRLAAHTIYECDACGSRALGERRCAECNTFRRNVGVGGLCPHCDEPILLTDLLD